MITAKPNRKAKIFLIALVFLFVGPIFASYFMYSFRIFIPETITYGHLILPPLRLNNLALQNSTGEQITANAFKGHWLILYVEPEQCEQLCLNTLYKMQQVRIRLGKNSDRVLRVILTLNTNQDRILKEYLASLYRGTLQLQTTKVDLTKFLITLPSHTIAVKTGYIFLVDPLGNVMMSYDPKQNPKDMYTDLTRLLKASNIG